MVRYRVAWAGSGDRAREGPTIGSVFSTHDATIGMGAGGTKEKEIQTDKNGKSKMRRARVRSKIERVCKPKQNRW